LQGALKKDYMFDINLVLNYQIPLKEGPQKANAAVNWLYLIKKEFMSEKVILESFEKFNKSTGELRIQRKIENTLSFYEFAKGKTMRDLLNFDF
jgi:hypothetical protein